MALASHRTVELRIHGVGPQTPADVLGVDDDREVRDIRPDLDAGRVWHRRRDTPASREWDPDVQAFMWDGLTSSSRFQALWPILAPFTLLNVAGYAHCRDDDSSRRPRLMRRLVLALGLTMSAAWGLWFALFAGYFTASAPTFELTARLAVEVVTGAVVVVGAFALARTFGRWAAGRELPPAAPPADRRASMVRTATVGVLIGLGFVGLTVASAWAMGDSSPFWWRATLGGAALALAGGVVAVALGTRRDFEDYRPVGRPTPGADHGRREPRANVESLSDTDFFASEVGRHHLAILHTLVLVGTTVVGLAGLRFADIGWWKGALTGTVTARLFLLVGAAQLVLLAVLYATSIGAANGEPNLRFRWAGPATTAGLAILLSNSVFGGFALLALHVAGAQPVGPELALIDATVVGLAVFVVLVLGLAVAAWSRRPPGPAGTARALARVPRNLDVVLFVAVAVTWVSGAVLFGWRFVHDELGSIGTNPATWVATYVYPALALAALGLVRRALLAATTRQQVGLVWDVLTFWPRRFHPFAVRPYAEKIVPQLQDHLVDELGRSKGVVISAHSQGSVIAYAALQGLAAAGQPLDRVALVTYGSPLLRLHARLWPSSFRIADYRAAACTNAPGPPDPPHRRLARVHGWSNFFHATDPVGQEVFTRLDERSFEPDGVRNPHDHVLPDPVEGWPQRSPADPPGDRSRTPNDGLGVHSQYRKELDVKDAIRSYRFELLRDRPARPSARSPRRGGQPDQAEPHRSFRARA